MLKQIIFLAITFVYAIMAHSAVENEKLSLARSCREFSTEFHKTVTKRVKGNVVDSPFATHSILSYLSLGADNRTSEEMLVGLRLTGEEDLRMSHRDLVKILSSDTIQLILANAIFLHEGLKLHETFLRLGTDFYDISTRSLNFRDKFLAALEINSWIAKSTQDRISDVISSDDIDEYTKVVLVNAMYLKARWRYPFKPENTKMRKFHLSQTQFKHILTMYKEYRYLHGEISSLNSRFLEIPYEDPNIDMIIILPNDIEGLSFVEENFDWEAIANAERSNRLTQLHLPKFKIEGTINLKSILVELGFTSMFEETADFTKMSDIPLKVDDVVQKSFIEVNESGTEAAAATVVRMMMKRSLEMMEEEPDKFIVDRPFVIVIRQVLDNIPLFLASVRDIGAITKKDEL